MLQRKLTTLAAAAGLSLAVAMPANAQELTIFWAEWDPANYLQELVNEYTEQTGVVVTVETTPWPDFQTKAFTEFNARGDAYDMVVGDSQWLGAGSTGGHYVDLSDFFEKHGVADTMAPATVKSYAEYDGKYWAIPVEGDATGWAYRKDWFEDPAEMSAFKAKYGYALGVPKTWTEMHDIAEFFHRPDENRYGIAIYTDNSYDALVMGFENALFSYGGDLGDYSTFKVEGIVNSAQAVEALEMYRSLYGLTPPNWGKVFFLENNQAATARLPNGRTAVESRRDAPRTPALGTQGFADATGRDVPVRHPRSDRSDVDGGQGRGPQRRAHCQNRDSACHLQSST